MARINHFHILLLGVLLLISSIALLSMHGGLGRITGNLMSTVFVTTKSPTLCPVTLAAGWNLVSFYCEAENMSIEALFPIEKINLTEQVGMNDSIDLNNSSDQNNSTNSTDPADSNNSISMTNTTYVTNLTIYSYDPLDISDSWKVYATGLPVWVKLDLQELDVTKGYWINIGEEYTVQVNGTLRIPAAVRLSSGWNLAGFPTNASQPVLQAIGTILNDVLIIHKYEPLSADKWKVYSPFALPAQNDLVIMEPNYGYWIRMNRSATWVIDQ
jgi:hypothetical protein